MTASDQTHETLMKTVAFWMQRWSLAPDGPAFMTQFRSCLAPVRLSGQPAMLKIAGHSDEREGAAVMAWWSGVGAARVLNIEGEALLLERAVGSPTLAGRVRAGFDDEATVTLCEVAGRLHGPRGDPPPLKPLTRWFQALEPVARARGGIFSTAHATARALLADPHDTTVLHGDLHHENVLNFGDAGWLAIDPKGLLGERGYDFANLFCNPWPEAMAPGTLERRLPIVARVAALEPDRLLRWILAYAGLSASWTLQSGEDPWRALQIAEKAAGLLGI